MTNYTGAPFEDQINKNLVDIQKDLAEVKTDLKKIKRYIFWGKVLNFLYLILIIAPVVLAIVFLPRIIQNFTQNYLNQVVPGSVPTDLNKIFENYKDLIK